ncbi:hypothetical protein Tco_1547518 [Tanacetum coccineum]
MTPWRLRQPPPPIPTLLAHSLAGAVTRKRPLLVLTPTLESPSLPECPLPAHLREAFTRVQRNNLCDSARTSEVILLVFTVTNGNPSSVIIKQHCGRRPYIELETLQGDFLNLPDHRIHKDGDGDASFQLKSDSLPHAHAQTTKTYYKHQDSRIMKAQELKTKTSAQTLIYKIFLQRYQVYQGRLLASFQDDAKYEHVGQDTRS